MPVEEIDVEIGAKALPGDLALPEPVRGLVVFAHGSGSSRKSPRNRMVAATLQEAGLATLLFDLLTPLEALEELYRGIGDLASRWQVNVLGGDTTAAPRDLVICITVYGEVAEAELLTRAGARPGDALVVTGTLGDSRAGLEILLGRARAEGEDAAALVCAHRRPVPHLAEGRFLAAAGGAVHAAIDVSDGLGADLGHLLEESGVGARLFASRLPVSQALRRFCRGLGRDPAEYAFAGGEDYVLLAAVAPEAVSALGKGFRERFGGDLAVIGEITAAGVREWIDETGFARELSAPGWDHFRKG